MMTAKLCFAQIENLVFELSMWRCNEELRVRADELHRSSKRDVKHYIEFWKKIPPNEPYRVILGDVRDKLYNAHERAQKLLTSEISHIPQEAAYTNIEQEHEKKLKKVGATVTPQEAEEQSDTSKEAIVEVEKVEDAVDTAVPEKNTDLKNALKFRKRSKGLDSLPKTLIKCKKATNFWFQRH